MKMNTSEREILRLSSDNQIQDRHIACYQQNMGTWSVLWEKIFSSKCNKEHSCCHQPCWGPFLPWVWHRLFVCTNHIWNIMKDCHQRLTWTPALVWDNTWHRWLFVWWSDWFLNFFVVKSLISSISGRSNVLTDSCHRNANQVGSTAVSWSQTTHAHSHDMLLWRE